ncbi:alpha/beta-hydrolase [Whalleya microplaca]|nr:alpha/beta-hydrolase [Whalleya microplaca]
MGTFGRKVGTLAIFVAICFAFFVSRTEASYTTRRIISDTICSYMGTCQHDLSKGTSAVDSPITLEGYGKFTGRTINTTLNGTPLITDVDAWLAIDYATQPIGERRFKPVDWPAPFDGVRAATKHGPACVQDPKRVKVKHQDEACLHFNVYRTKGIPLSKKLPVFVYIHGGSFNFGSWGSLDAASFVAFSKAPITVVSFHYRLNSLGFLPSKLFEEEDLLNLGLQDQYFFLRHFLQKHISSFGGDPKEITLGGRSAGGHSVGIHHFHNYGQDAGKPYFARAIYQSGSVTARAFPNATYPLYTQQFNEYMTALHCPIDDNAAALKCLRSANISDIRDISTKLYRKAAYNVTWPFQPTQGGPMLEKLGSESGYNGSFFHVPIITTSVTNEGRFAVPTNLNTSEDFLKFMHTTSPGLTTDDLNELETLYPDPITDPTSPYRDSPKSKQFSRVAAAWSDYGYICPVQETAYRVSKAGMPTWKARFNTNNKYPAWKGIPHAADGKYTWPDTKVQYPDVGHILHGYLSSFVTTGDPNTNRYPGSPEWPKYEPKGYGLDSMPADQLVLQPKHTEVETDYIRRDACLFWRDPKRAARLNK